MRINNKSKIFFVTFFSLIFVIFGYSFYKYLIAKDYFILSEVDCNPAVSACFVRICDPVEDETCPTDPTEQIYYYNLIHKKASNVPQCDTSVPNCANLVCETNEDCKEIYCDNINVPEGETCNDPAIYEPNFSESENSITGDALGPDALSNGEASNSNNLIEDLNPNLDQNN
ncbi:MAG: hypothetical protein WCV73_00705 [Patescibacteria group bacterium]|jgi:hypothetical protein